MNRVFILALLMFSATSSLAQQRQGLSAKEIRDKMVSNYASCTSYSDQGEVKSVFLRTGSVSLRPFSTAFVRPGKLRFEFQDRFRDLNTDYVVWQDGASIKSWWSIKPEVRLFETLDLALTAATGVSGASAIVVPSMLLGDLHDSQIIQNLTQLVLVGEEMSGGRTAYKIAGTARDQQMTIWIDKESFLLLKTFQLAKLPSGDAEKTITYKAEINKTIPADKLAFNH
jgi:outer membrane lipoprotein-sorting protein